MRLAVKSTVTLVVLYVLLLGGLVLWSNYELRSVAASLLEDTIRIIGNDVAAALSESAREQLLLGDPATRQRLVQVVADLTQHSDVVASIAVVDEAGRVVVADELGVGQQVAAPGVIFEHTTQPQFLSPPSLLHGGLYHLFVPLLRQGAVVGYIRLSLSSHRIAVFYQRARQRLAVAALAGLTGLAAVGVLLHVQLSRRGAALVRALEATARGETLPAPVQRDEFSRVLDAAGRLGQELSRTRERGSQAERRVSALANFMDIGVCLLGADQRLEFANAAARELFGCTKPGELEQRWSGLKHIVPQLTQAARTAQGVQVDVEVPVQGQSRSLRLELHRPEEDEHGGYLMLAKDRAALDAFETDLRLASQMRGLARVYGALAHELKAPLGAMALNLELLTGALSADADTDPLLQDRRTRYAAVLREELARLNRSLISVLNQTAALGDACERFDLREVIRDLEALLAPQAELQQIVVEVQLPDRDVPLVGHRDRLKQALLNIATNALEAMPHGGALGMALDAHDGQARIAIRDSGPGMAPEVLAKMYSMYFTTKSGGTGIGLYVARSAVESDGGEIQVESRCGEGTCFTVSLPLAGQET
jgi:signal transduction histidine kinase